MKVRDVDITGVERNAEQQIVRKWMVHLLDANFGNGNPAWYRFGRDLQEYNVEMNPDTEMRKNINGSNTFIHNGYEQSGENDTFYAHINDPLFGKLQEIVDYQQTGDACKTSSLEVHTWEETGDGTNIFKAAKQDCYVVPTSYGGDTGGYQIPYQVHYVGDKTMGTYNALTKTFTPGADSEEAANAKLSVLTVGNLTLTPAFNAEVVSYRATTANASDIVTVLAADRAASVTVTNGSTPVANGSAATWADGENTLTIAVTNGSAVKTYTVTVTKTAS